MPQLPLSVRTRGSVSRIAAPQLNALLARGGGKACSRILPRHFTAPDPSVYFAWRRKNKVSVGGGFGATDLTTSAGGVGGFSRPSATATMPPRRSGIVTLNASSISFAALARYLPIDPLSNLNVSY